MSSMFTKKMLKDAEEDYFATLHSTLDGFTRMVSIQLNGYIFSLQTFYQDKIFEECKTDEIFDFIKKYDYKKHEDFVNMYYIIPDGTTYLSNGQILQLSPDNHLALLGENDIYISGVFTVPTDKNNYVFLIEKAIYKDNIIQGVLGVSVSIENFRKRITGLRVGNRESFMILDKDGTFIIHKRDDVIGVKYEPEDKKYSDGSTVNLAKNPPQTIITQDSYGDLIYLCTSKVPESDWTLALKVSMDEINTIYLPEKRNEIIIILFSVLTILALVFIEAKVFDFFQKKQLIATVYDPLTNLWTRQRFETEANRIVKNSRAKFMLIEADIRGFKFINQNYGEEAADKLIVYYSKMLNKYVTEYHGIMGRGFADHFYILVKITSVHRAMSVLKNNINVFTNELKSYDIPFFPKFGISFLMPGDDIKGNKIQSLIGQASFAKSTIKDNLLTQFSVYNSKLLEKINEERFIESHMQQALEQKEFFVMYQPKISLVDDKIVGAEALVRWNSPKLGLMTPDKFIPLFERNGFITKLDYYVYEEVFKFIQNRLSKNLPIVPISVNMSRNHNKPDKFIHDFMEIFTKYSIPSKLIQIEILERSVMDNSTLKDITEKLHKEGFTVAMDDFGSGESSLNMLTKIPVDVLKFDREFLNDSTDKEGRIDKKSEKFIHILIDLSKNLDKQTVFEGVETQAQRDFLRSIECDQAQGFFYSKPLSEQDFVQFIQLHS